MDSILEKIREGLRVLRYQRREQKTALLAALCFGAIPLLKLLPLDPLYLSIATWPLVGLGALSVLLTAWRLSRYTLAPHQQEQVPGVAAIKGAGAFTPDDAELFARLGRLEELKQLHSWILDDKLPVVVVMGESGAGKTSLLRAGLAFILSQGEERIPSAYWEASPVDSRESFLHAVEAQLGSRDLSSLPNGVVVVDQLEQLDPERDIGFFHLLRQYLESSPPYKVTWIVAFRREFGATWMDFQLDLPERCRHRLQLLSLHRFSQQQAKEVFATLAEEADLPVRESLMQEVLRQLSEDGSISPVDLGIMLQVFHRQPHLAVDTTAFHFADGQAGLLTHYLEMALEPYPPSLKEDVLRALLALMDHESDRRLSGGLQIEELRDCVGPQVSRHFALAFDALAEPGMRVLENIEGRYRLIHERFIPAVRRLAGKLLNAADRASRLLERRFQQWEHEEHQARFLLRGTELREVLGQRASLRWGTNRDEKWRFLKASYRRRRWRRLWAAVGVILIGSASALAYLRQRAQDGRKEMFEWGFPKGTYELLPRITELSVPQVSNFRWLSRTKRLEDLEVRLKPHRKFERNQNWPLSLQGLALSDWSTFPRLPSTLKRLSLNISGSLKSSLLEFPPTLQQLDLHFSGSGVSSLPEYPPTLREMSIALFGLGISNCPKFPSTLRRLTIVINYAFGLSNLPAFPPTLQELSLLIHGNSPKAPSLPKLPSTLRKLNISVDDESSLLEFPSALQQLTIDIFPSNIKVFPKFPTTLRDLVLRSDNCTIQELPPTLHYFTFYCHGEGLNLPKFPSTLRQITLGVQGWAETLSWPEFPPTLRQLTLDTTGSKVTNLPEFPETLRQLSLYISDSEVSNLPEFPLSLDQLTLHLSGSKISSLPKFPSTLKELTLEFSSSQISTLPEFPSTLQGIALTVSGSDVLSWPEFPSNIEQLALDVSSSEVTNLPRFPSALQQLTLDVSSSEVSILPALPLSLQSLTLYASSSKVLDLPTLPETTRCLALEVSIGSSIVLKYLPDNLENIKLSVGRDQAGGRYSC